MRNVDAIICVEHLVKANRKMKLELGANRSGTLNECKRKRSMNLVRGTKIGLGLFYKGEMKGEQLCLTRRKIFHSLLCTGLHLNMITAVSVQL